MIWMQMNTCSLLRDPTVTMKYKTPMLVSLVERPHCDYEI